MIFTSPLIVRHWRAALLLVAGVLFSPGRSSAECGDYLTIHKQRSEANGDRAMPVSEQDVEYNFGHSLPSKQPCHGPNCSSSPVREFPPLAPVIPTGPQLKDLAQQLYSTDQETALGSEFARDNPSVRPIHRASSVFHPPRLTSIWL
jgi:hypothetical protein